jgi:hypothetical protein
MGLSDTLAPGPLPGEIRNQAAYDGCGAGLWRVCFPTLERNPAGFASRQAAKDAKFAKGVLREAQCLPADPR